MALIRIQDFAGIAPKVNPKALPAVFAQVANNVRLGHKDLRAFFNDLQVYTAGKLGNQLSIWRMGQSALESQHWLTWLQDVDVVPSPVAGNTNEVLYYTGDGEPRKTDLTLALSGGGTQFPNAYRTLGVPKPSSAATATPGGAVSGTATTENRNYVYTFVSADGEESAPSAPSNTAVVQSGQVVTVAGMLTALAGTYNIDRKRIYATVAGAQSADYFFAAEIPIGQASYVDTGARGDPLPTLGWLPPAADLKGLIKLPNGNMAAFRANEVWQPEPYVPYAWPVRNMKSFAAQVVGLGSVGSTIVVATDRIPYLIEGIDPYQPAQREAEPSSADTDTAQPCSSKRSVRSVSGGVCYASPNGLILVSPAGSVNLTQALFSREDWQSMNPASVWGVFHDGRYFGFYNNGTTAGWVYHFSSGLFTKLDFYAHAGYVDQRSGALYLAVGQLLYRFEGATAGSRQWTWRSQVFEQAQPTNYAFAQVSADTYPVTFRLYGDGVLRHTQTVADFRPFTLPDGYTADKIEIELVGNTRVYRCDMATSLEELAKT